jgi:hypothetical protein
MDENYIRALQTLKNLLPDEAQGEFSVYEARMMDNLYRQRMFGTNPTASSEWAMIMDGLNRLTQKYGLTSFNDLAYSDRASGIANPPQAATTAGPATGSQQTATRGKPARTTPPEPRISLLTDTIPTAYYHYLDAKRFPLVKVQIDNSGPDCDDATLTISTVIEDHSDTSTTTLKVKKGERREKTLMPLLKAPALKALHNVQRVSLHVTVRQNAPITAILDERTEHLRLLARNSALLGARGLNGEITDLTKFLAAWVTPYSLPMQHWLHSAGERLPDPQRGFVGYEEGDTIADIADNVRAQARAIFQVLKERSNIQYRHLPTSQGATDNQIVQRVQLPVESLTTKFANCIEGSVLFASLLEAAAIDPVIVLIPEHAFVGWHINRDVDQYEFLDTTKISSESFENAQKIAQDYFTQAQQAGDFERDLFDPRGFARIIDVAACRKEGIYSLESDWDRDIALSNSPRLDTASDNLSHPPTSRPQSSSSVNSANREPSLTSLPTNLGNRYRNLLLDSGMCDSAGKLRSLFVGELATYRHRLPDGTDAQDRASQLIAYLDGKTKQGRPVLLILLEHLRPHMPDDDGRSELEQLYREMGDA